MHLCFHLGEGVRASEISLPPRPGHLVLTFGPGLPGQRDSQRAVGEMLGGRGRWSGVGR